MKENTTRLIAVRKSCTSDGTGLSHYILMDQEAQK